jgi:hypothetical protein
MRVGMSIYKRSHRGTQGLNSTRRHNNFLSGDSRLDTPYPSTDTIVFFSHSMTHDIQATHKYRHATFNISLKNDM